MSRAWLSLLLWPEWAAAQALAEELPFREAGSVGMAQVIAALIFLALLGLVAFVVLRMRGHGFIGATRGTAGGDGIQVLATRRLGPRLQLTMLDIEGARWLVFDNGQALSVARQDGGGRGDV